MNNMKKHILLSLLLVITSTITLYAEKNISEVLPKIEGSYLHNALQPQEVLYSSFTDKEYLIRSFILENKKNFRSNDLMTIRENLNKMSSKELMLLNDIEFKDPTISVVLSVLTGGLGVDRFYIGDIGLGVAKLLTAGGLGIWWLIDMFTISNKTKKNNAQDLREVITLQDYMTE